MENPLRNQNSDERRNLLEVMEDFTGEYNIPPLDSYISYFKLSTVGEHDANAEEEEKNKSCIVVKLREPLPQGTSIPSSYKDIRVFVI